MKQILRPGAEIDFVTSKEMAAHLTGFQNTLIQAMSHSAIFRRVFVQMNNSAGVKGTLLGQAGPDDGFVWDVRSIMSSDQPIDFWYNYNNASSYINTLAGSGTAITYNKQVVVHSGETLYFTEGQGSQINHVSVVRLDVIEVPAAKEGALYL